MPRSERKRSKTGIYHVMQRGINQQIIFEDDEDYEKMLQTLSDVKAVSKCKILAYCLMQNHYHLLLKEEEESLEQIFKRIGARYVYWYNVKYKRTGHLFQDRFKSEVVEDDKYLLAVLRYIHQNPVKAGICEQVSDFRWSSYNEFIECQNIVDTEYIYEMMNKEEFAKFNQQESEGKFLDYEETKLRVSDSEAKKLIEEISKCNNASEFQQLDLQIRNLSISKFKEKGISIRQINRLTGVSKSIIERL